jgi:phosphatidylserine/phosphatidylglycerophosphate/cardiolipin synthase-like enzyme
VATFAPFVTASAVRRAGPDLVLTLPDPTRAPGEPLVRPGVARLAGAPLVLVPLAPSGAATSLEVRSPVTGFSRRVELGTIPPPGLPGVLTALEIAPLPFAAAAVLRRLPGLPTFYVAIPGLGATPADDDVVSAGEPLGTPAAVWVGALFADRVAVSAATVIDLVAEAMAGTDTAADITAWQTLASLAEPGRSLRVLDHAGRPGASYRVRVTSPGGTSVLTADPDGSVALPPGELSLRWIEDGAGAAPGRPVHALYERSLADPADEDSSSQPGEPIVVPASVSRGHVQVIDADRWFAERPPGLDPGLGLVHPGSRLQPLVDGLATFTLMLDDLRHATGPGCGAHFAGWAFNDFPLDLRDVDATMFTDLVRALRQGTGPGRDAIGARFLMDKYIAFREDAPAGEQIELAAVLLLIAGGDALVVAGLLDSLLDLLPRDPRWVAALLVLATVAVYLTGALGAGALLTAIEEKIDGSGELAAALNAIRPNVALRARHPATFRDNPLSVPNPLPIDVTEYLTGTGSYHQKFQVIRREVEPSGHAVIGYVGGVDINQNRLDSPGHHGSAWRPADAVALSPAPKPRAFHDVHARVTGPAAADVALTFERRWAFDRSRQPVPAPGEPPLLDVAFPAPAPTSADVPPQSARHLVQICRSGYRPLPGGGTPLPWSPLGEATIAEAVVNAIRGAREYIYIEDQYFTPHNEYIGALLDAAVREPSLRLVVVMPSASDQVFGDTRHKEMFELLRAGRPGEEGYGERLILAAPVRRPLLGDAGRTAGLGRLVLQDNLTATGDQILLGPRSRLPGSVPFWLWVDGERMLAIEKRDDLLSETLVPSRRFLVLRAGGAATRWGAQPRTHDAGAAVTMAQISGIYVHTKVIVVDDIFVGIGSCNTNRRGFFHDGEIQAFAVPEQLKASPENPALALRTALWAEHLGLPPAMGPCLLADPVAAFELFRRSTYVGNRMSTFDALGARTDLAFLGEKAMWAESIATLLGSLSADLLPYVWNIVIEPTTGSDPDPVLGPEVGDV